MWKKIYYPAYYWTEYQNKIFIFIHFKTFKKPQNLIQNCFWGDEQAYQDIEFKFKFNLFIFSISLTQFWILSRCSALVCCSLQLQIVNVNILIQISATGVLLLSQPSFTFIFPTSSYFTYRKQLKVLWEYCSIFFIKQNV